jgi:phosphohistidine swiveling domain-containing protein
VVTTAAFDAVAAHPSLRAPLAEARAALISGDGERAVDAGRRAADALRVVPLPEALLRGGAAMWRELACGALEGGRVLLAVRSSAAAEDGARHSHAGQFDSVLNVSGLSATWAATRLVWASWFSERAVRYRLQVRREHGESEPSAGSRAPLLVPSMAVIVQQMVVPRASGILFTADPVTGSRRELTLEAGPGLGEAIAQGRVHPDFVRLRRDPLRIVQRSVAPRVGRIDPLPPGSSELLFREPPERAAPRRAACVRDDEVLAIARTGLAIEAAMHAPVDVEWTLDRSGRLYVVQARPVTALPRRAATTVDELRARPVLWTQRFCGERWTDQATPLGWSVIQPILHHFTLWEDARDRWLDGSDPTRLYRGRPYFNITIFRHLAFKLPGGTPPQLILEMVPPEEAEVLANGPAYAPNLALVASIFGQVWRERRWERYRYNFVTNHADWAAFEPGLRARTEALPLDFESAEDGLAAVDAARALIVEYLEIHLLSLLFAHLTYELLGLALRSWVGEGGEAVKAALVADADNATLKVNQDLWELAGVARRHPGLAQAILSAARTGWSDDPLDDLRDLDGGPQFVSALDVFLAAHGHRSDASWEIFSARWADAPETVLSMVASVIRAGDHADPYRHQAARDRERAHAEELVRARMGRSRRRRLIPWRRAVFRELLSLCRSYMALRENQRYAFDRLLLRLKRIVERQGALLERDHKLASGDQIMFAELAELRALATGRIAPDELAPILAERAATFARWRGSPRPDFLLAGDHPVAPSVPAPTPASDERTLDGLGISPGSVRGTVKVLRTLADMTKLQPGDILVARSTDPGWTPLFLTAAGLILELGSLLSHGAVVAREYRLPAVVNVEGATRVLEDGMEVTIDGDRGRVILHRAN